MSLDTLTVDAYQLTTLVAHADAGRTQAAVAMAFFFRKLPRNRNYVLFCGLRQILEHAAAMRFDAREIETLLGDPLLGPALRARPELVAALRALDGFDGEIDALPEGTPAFAGPALRSDGTPVHRRRDAHRHLHAAHAGAHRSVARQADRDAVARAHQPHEHGGVEGGARRRGGARQAGARVRRAPHASGGGGRRQLRGLDLAGCAATSNVAALRRWGVPIAGTMDHFFVQATEQIGEKWPDSERDAFAQFYRAFPAQLDHARRHLRDRRGHSPRRRGHRRQADRRAPRLQRHAGDGGAGAPAPRRARRAAGARSSSPTGSTSFAWRSSTAPTATAWARTSAARPTPPSASAPWPS